MSNPNFVNDLVMMAKAYEELPGVKEALFMQQNANIELSERIQALELKLIDRANELDAAHAATRKAEVERDHAETMFLETDDKLSRAKDVLKVFIGDAQDYLRAVEPQPKPEVKVGASEEDVAPLPKAIDNPIYTDPQMPEQGQSESGEHGLATTSMPTDATSQSETATSSGAESTVPVSTEHSEASEVVPADPTASSTAGDGPLLDTAVATTNAEPQADASTSEQSTATQPVDDVGYHNEPNYGDYLAWDAWLARMNARYGVGQWPGRYPSAAQ